MTFEKWMEEVANQLPEGIVFSNDEEPPKVLAKMEDFMDEDWEEE